MVNNNGNQQKLKQKESLGSRKKKSTARPLADLIRQINDMSMSKKAKDDNLWQPDPPLAA
jgi:hypothetical protein